MRFKKQLLTVLVLLALLLAACGGAEDAGNGGDSGDGGDGGEEIPAACPEWTSMTAELEAACHGEYDGMVVTMTGPFTDEDEVKFNESVAAFEEATGIDIQYTGTKEFETIITAAVQGGDAPDVVDFPQPGLLLNFVQSGDVVDVSTFLNADWMSTNYKQAWLDMAMMEGPDGEIMAGVWARFNGKSQVWYPKAAWDAAGYEVPETWDDLIALSDQIYDDGGTPWCIGIESGTATGWAATDWMEEIMLRTTSLENYDNWSFPADPANRLPFTSPEVKNAAEVMSEIWFNDDYVAGGRAAIADTFFGDSPVGMFDDPPSCWLHKQGNFITSFFPEGTEAGVDYDFFYLPPIDPAYGSPYLIAGDIYAMFNDRPEVRAVVDFFTRGESLKTWLASGGALSPHNDASLDWYGDDIERSIAEAVQQADSVRFDGSDLMPGAVGAGTFWKSMTDYVSGTVDLDTALAEADAGWSDESVEQLINARDLLVRNGLLDSSLPINIYNIESSPDLETGTYVVTAPFQFDESDEQQAVLVSLLEGGSGPLGIMMRNATPYEVQGADASTGRLFSLALQAAADVYLIEWDASDEIITLTSADGDFQAPQLDPLNVVDPPVDEITITHIEGSLTICAQWNGWSGCWTVF